MDSDIRIQKHIKWGGGGRRIDDCFVVDDVVGENQKWGIEWVSCLTETAGGLANTLQAEALDSSAVDGDRASGTVGVVAGLDAVDLAAGIGSGLVLVTATPGLANGRCLMAVGSDVLESAVDVTAFDARGGGAEIALLAGCGVDHSVTAEVGGGCRR